VWKKLIADLPADSEFRHKPGFWTFSFSIDPFNSPRLAELNTALERDMPKYSGWPPFTYLHGVPKNPQALGENVQAWIVDDIKNPTGESRHADFWRVSRGGYGFLLRPMQEDSPLYGSNTMPPPRKPIFDWVLPIYRCTELLKYVEALALKFADENAEFSVLLKYYNTRGRRLDVHDWRYNVMEGAVCAVDKLESKLSGPVHSIRTNLEEQLFGLLAPIYEQFEFQELPKLLVYNVVKEEMGNHRKA